MNEPQTFQLLDFTSPRRLRKEKWRALSKWHQNICLLTTEAWASLISHETVLSATRIEPFQRLEAVQRTPDDAVGVQLSIGPDQTPSLMIFSGKQLHGLLADVLDVPGTEWPTPAKFTPAEESILSVMFQRLASAVGDGIPGPEAIRCEFVSIVDRPRRTRLFSLIDELFVLEIGITSRFGEDTAFWMLPKKEVESLVGHEALEEEYDERPVQPAMIALTHRMPVTLVVELGTTNLSMAQMTQLGIGDVLVLDQSINRPIQACLAGTAKLTGRPVRVGIRQGFAVTEQVGS